MIKKYTSKEFWKLYDKLPKELQDALFAEETGENIYDVCEKNKVLENLNPIVKYVGHVLLGVLLPEEFQKILEKELKLKKEIAKKVTQELNRLIFHPVKSDLKELHKIEIVASTKPKTTLPIEEESSAPPRKDGYRESIE